MSAHARNSALLPRVAARDLPASRVLCLYHYPCHDGVFAALALHCHYQSRSIPVEFIPHKTFETLDIEGLGIKVRLPSCAGGPCVPQGGLPRADPIAPLTLQHTHACVHSCRAMTSCTSWTTPAQMGLPSAWLP